VERVEGNVLWEGGERGWWLIKLINLCVYDLAVLLDECSDVDRDLCMLKKALAHFVYHAFIYLDLYVGVPQNFSLSFGQSSSLVLHYLRPTCFARERLGSFVTSGELRLQS
jgi:hypothetical protein